jgi:anti-sigma factor (TIGR02949 family)
MMNCDEIRKTVYLFIDGEMPGKELREFASHLDHCEGCSRLVEMERAVIKTIKVRTPRYHAPASLRALVAEAGEAASPADLVMGWFTRRRFAVLAAVAAMALVVLAVYVGFEGVQGPDVSGGATGGGMALRPVTAHQGTGLPSVVTSIGGADIPMAGLGAFSRVKSGGPGAHAWTGLAGRDAVQLKLKSLRQRAEMIKSRKVYLVRNENRIFIQPEFASAEADEEGDTPLPVQAQYGYFISDR